MNRRTQFLRRSGLPITTNKSEPFFRRVVSSVAATIIGILDYKLFVSTGILLLLAAPISLAITGEENLARRMAEIAYFLLVAGVLACLFGYLRKR